MIPSITKMLIADRYQVLAILMVLLLPSPAVSITPAPPPPASDYPNPYGNIKPQFGLVVLIVTALIFLLAFFSLCVRHCGNRRPSSVSAVATTRTRRGHHGLDPAVLQTFPIFNYSAVKEMKIGKGALECAVCLSEFENDETLRFIPKCDHVFHAECIDTWLESHATCPVCRANLVPVPGESFDLPVLGPSRPSNQNDDVSIHVECETTMEQPLNERARMSLIRSRTRGMSGRRRWFGLFLRSNSTGHAEVNHAGDTERFTLRLPADLRRQIIGGKLSRTTSCLAPATAVGSRLDNRVRFGGSYNEGSSQGQGRLGGRFSKADRWVSSVTRPFSTVAQPALPPV